MPTMIRKRARRTRPALELWRFEVMSMQGGLHLTGDATEVHAATGAEARKRAAALLGCPLDHLLYGRRLA